MSDAISIRLRKAMLYLSDGDLTDMGEEAADAIDALQAENARLRRLLDEAASDLSVYVESEYPADSCAEYPDIAKRHFRDMQLVRQIRAALSAEKPT